MTPLDPSPPPRPRTGFASRARLGTLLTTWALSLGLSALDPAWAEDIPPSPSGEVVPPTSRTEDSLVVRGIYLQQRTVEDEKRLEELIGKARKAGFNTFVVDLTRRSPEYAKAVKTIQDAGLHYVPRITMFPDGARPGQLDDRELLEKRWRMAEHAVKLGATDVQLDYIRFSSRNLPSPENATKVREVLRFFRERLKQRGARLQIDIFGEVSYGPSIRIGQDIRVFAPELDAVCPMLYPSHFEPHEETVKTPYGTVHGALTALERQTKGHPLPVYPYIEHFNYRHRMTEAERGAYFEAQLEAVLHSNAQGFYIWSVGNYYDIPFAVLERRARERRDHPPLAGAPSTVAPGVGSLGGSPATP